MCTMFTVLTQVQKCKQGSEMVVCATNMKLPLEN